MLKDLAQLIATGREVFDALPSNSDIYITDELAPILYEALKLAEPTSEYYIRRYSIELINSDGLRADIPSAWLWYGFAFYELKQALNEYQNCIKQARANLKEKGISSKDIVALLREFPKENSLSTTDPLVEGFKVILQSEYANDWHYLERFLTDRSWWIQPLKETANPPGKTLDRNDIFKSAFYLACKVIVANSDRLTTIGEAFVQSPKLIEHFNKLDYSSYPSLPTQSIQETESSIIPIENHMRSGTNKIYYGAPGTGKSYAIEQQTNTGHTFRTVFHPDTQYSDFIGSLKPAMVDGVISYSFRPGSFTDAIVHAVTHPDAECALVIEEINRAAAAAAFGEIFQLLDRGISKASKYPIHVSDPDWLEYLNSKTEGFFSDGKLFIPSNLSILATMNSSDQAVMPLDTAFKRRWEFEYLPLDYENAAQGTLPLALYGNGKIQVMHVQWSDFAKAINNVLAVDHIPEDKLLGHRFLDDTELNENGANSLKGKLFMYLWDDVLRHGQRDVVFADTVTESGEDVELTTYGRLITAYDDNQCVLVEHLSETLFQMTIAREEQQ